MIAYEDAYATIRYNKTGGYIYHSFHQPIGGDCFFNVLETGLRVLEKHSMQKWLSDDRLNNEFSPEDIHYSVTNWGPRAVEAGWKYWALVVPESLAGRVSMQEIVQTYYELGIEVSVFNDLDAAREWLIHC